MRKQKSRQLDGNGAAKDKINNAESCNLQFTVKLFGRKYWKGGGGWEGWELV
jgi:hypothetical protein